jgi:hypothetical protein
LVTDAEVFQEILHRYVSIRRHDAIQSAFDTLSGLVDDVFPIDLGTITKLARWRWAIRAIGQRRDPGRDDETPRRSKAFKLRLGV